MVEYIIIVGVVALGAQTAFRAFGRSINGKVNEQANTVAGVGGGDCVGGLCTVVIKREKED
jgi:hypothetical protein